MSVEAMKQALNALNTTDTHPISSAEQYDKEMQAMEALRDAIADAEESEWVGLTDEDIDEASESRTGCEKYAWVERVIRNAEAKLKEKNHA
jgi:hypothetical protein